MSSLTHLNIQTPSDTDDPLPTVTLTRRVLEKIFLASLQHATTETGEALVGVAMQSNDSKLPKMYIIDTVPPVTEAVREWAMFEQGDDWQAAIFNWWYENWELYRELRRNSYGNAVMAKWDVPLRHLGDWHKQPDGMINPSQGDMRTAKAFMRDMDLDYLLTPIVTFEEGDHTITTSNTIAIATSESRLRIDFWWVARRGNRFEPLRPILEANGSIPRLPEVVWWLADRQRFDAEISALEQTGLEIMDIVSWSENGRPPLDTCFIIYRPGNPHVWLAITAANYPQRAPTWRTAPIMRPDEDSDLFAALYAASEKVPQAILPKWTTETQLVDAIEAIEAEEKRQS